MTPTEREEMEREAARIRSFKGKVKMFRCACGNELETDMETDKAIEQPCGFCGKTAWTQKLGKAMANDPTAPLEMKRQSKKDKEEKANDE